MKQHEIQDLLNRARTGDDRALGQLLERYRPYLHLLAERDLDRQIRARVDPSDIVQQTFLDAQQDLPKFRGESENELAAWLRTMLANNLGQTFRRHLRAQKRSAYKERRLSGPSPSSQPHVLASEQSTPSQRMMRGESAIELARALEALPQDQRDAVRLRYLEGMTLKEMASYFSRSEEAVAGLLKRGLRKLREKFHEAETGDL